MSAGARSALRRAVGPLTVLAGVGALLVSVPTRWYGGRVPGDAYVFDPPPFSALWFERAVVPPVTVLVGLLAVAGLAALLARDRAAMARWHRWVAAVGVAGCLLLTVALALLGGPRSDTLGALGGVLVGLLGVVLALVGLVGWGAGHLRAGRRRLGSALAGGPLGTVAAVAALSAVDIEGGGLLAVLPVVATLVVVGHELHVGGADAD